MRIPPVGWSILQQACGTAGQYLIVAFLSTVVTPRDFGTLQMALVWIAFMTIFSDFALGTALIQRKDISESHLSSVFWMNVAMGAVLMGAGHALARPAAVFFRNPEVQPVLQVLSLNFLAQSLSAVHGVLALKALRFRDLALRDLLATGVSGVVAIPLAFYGWGVWSLVAVTVTTTFVRGGLLWLMVDWRPARTVSLQAIRELWSFGSVMFVHAIFKFLVQNVDHLLLGRLLGPTALGLYGFGQKIVLTPTAVFRTALGAYMFPSFSRYQHEPERIRESYLRLASHTINVMAPVMAVVVVCSSWLVPAVFGPQWSAAVPLVNAFAFVAVAQLIIAPSGEIAKALGKPKWLLNWAIGFSLCIAAGVAIGAQWGVSGVSLAIVVAHAIAIPINLVMIQRLVAVRSSEVVKALLPGLATSFIFIGIAPLVMRLLRVGPPNAWWAW
jgi:O-antigen/teichoic acid export membrane protein